MILYQKLQQSTRLFRKYLTFTASKNCKRNMKVLNVAEKNDAARTIAHHLSNGNSRRREGYSVYNKIYDFNFTLFNEPCEMRMTSVSGHLLNHDFDASFRKWSSCHPSALFDAPIKKECAEPNTVKIKRTLEREVKPCTILIIWTDCDREGENIGYEIITVCKAVKPNIRIYRAKFSEITPISVNRAIKNLIPPNKAVSDAVEVRSELDLRIGAAFTRFQTMFLKKIFPNSLGDLMLSYGSCQFPTLGFVVERYLAIEAFVPEPYWKLKVRDTRDNLSADFFWGRHRLFEKAPCQALLEECLDDPQAKVKKVISKPKTKFRPMPLDTVELQKQIARKLRISAKETMTIAEKLYTQGFISYPRTETNIFPKELNLIPLVSQQMPDDRWGDFAQRLVANGVHPRQGKKTDEAHPPIHPTKYTNTLQGNAAKVYEYIVRHFLACLSSNAEGQETIIEIELAGEKFTAKGLQIIAKNYLEVYIYERWSEKEMPMYREGQVFRPSEITMLEEGTSPPQLLTEADLIALMDRHGIGTDATHADHIDTIKKRFYADLTDSRHLMPGKLGIGLVMGYDNMGFHMSKPNLRTELERDLKLICEQKKNPSDVLQAQIAKYRHVYKQATQNVNVINESLANYLDERPNVVIGDGLQMIEQPVFQCPKCSCNMSVKCLANNGMKVFIGCMAYPSCNNTIWFPRSVENVEVTNELCTRCSFPIYKLKFTFNMSVLVYYGKTYTTCIGGCNPSFNEDLTIQSDAFKKTNASNRRQDTVTNIVSSNYRRNEFRKRSNADTRTNQAQDDPANWGNNIFDLATDDAGGSAQQLYRPGRTESARNVPRSPSLSPMEPPRKRLNIAPDSAVTRNIIPKAKPPTETVKKGTAPTWGEIRDDEQLMCHCHELALRLKVKKEGANKGRDFFKCARPPENACKFFVWATDSPTQNSSSDSTPGTSQWTAGSSNASFSNRNSGTRSFNSNNLSRTSRDSGWESQSGASTSGTAPPTCHCNKPALKKTVLKESANKGREFYGCWSGMARACNFFQWADETSSQTQTYKPTTKRPPQRKGGNNDFPKQRKCGICGIAGHTRKTCTQNSLD